jgi:hypothetical protein
MAAHQVRRAQKPVTIARNQVRQREGRLILGRYRCGVVMVFHLPYFDPEEGEKFIFIRAERIRG